MRRYGEPPGHRCPPRSFSRLEMLVLAGTIFLLQLAGSHWWISRFRYGPLEWLWRCLTCWTILALTHAGEVTGPRSATPDS